MCGITGILNLKNSSEYKLNKNHIIEMTKVLSHRGPDNFDVWCEDNVFLGHTRLSILDLTSKGHQPMISKSNRYVITFNGEIYNFKELKSKLNSEHDIKWKGNSDTEVFLECIEAWGVDTTLKMSRGMFAFGIWDRAKKALILARDRVGEKPLYYGFLDSQIVFASELKSIKTLKKFGLTLNQDAMNLMIKLGYIPSPHTIYNNFFKLPPGTKLEISDKCSSDEISKWWDINFCINEAKSQNHGGEFTEITLHDTLKSVVKEQMLSDVPIGAFLSGGIDSSLIVSLMQEQSRKKIKTFTIGFSESDYNEAKYAKKISNILGTDHHEFYVSPKDTIDVIPQIPSVYDEPFGDSSQIPTTLISKLTSKHVKVCLSGDGGDELFGGYNRYLWSDTIVKNFEHLPLNFKKLISSSCSMISPSSLNYIFQIFSKILPLKMQYNNFGDKLHKFGDLIDFKSREDLYIKMISQWRKKIPTFYSIEDNKFHDLIGNWNNNLTYIENMMKTDIELYLPDDILVKVDRASMSYGLETRVPFLDERVIMSAWSIPIEKKIIQKKGKIPLRNILQKYIPNNLIDRPKQGFGIPIDVWLRGPLKDWASDLLNEKKLNENQFFNSKLVNKKWQEHLSGERNWQHPIWNILMLQSWLENN